MKKNPYTNQLLGNLSRQKVRRRPLRARSKSHSRKKNNSPAVLRRALAFTGTLGLLVLVFSAITVRSLVTAPKKVEYPAVVTVLDGSSFADVAQILKDQKLIKKKWLFAVFVKLHSSNPTIQAGEFTIPEPKRVGQLVDLLIDGQARFSDMRLTFPEGGDLRLFAQIAAENLSNITEEDFLAATENQEGYLFPDTYFFRPGAGVDDVVSRLTEEFMDQTASLQNHPNINENFTFDDAVNLASIIQKEAKNDLNEKKMVSGILHNRLNRDMLLQVDAPFVYEQGKGSADLRISDLRTDSPYNTYTNLGLPPTPIGNPGMNAIVAALEPAETRYLFYLHAPDGTIHYATNHDGHVANKQRYLR